MSGGVGPTGGDIRLPKEEEEEIEHHHPSKASPATAGGRRPRLLSFRQLNALAVIVVFSASGMVAPEDLAFFLFSLAYVYFLSCVAFPSTTTASPEPPVFGEKNRVLGLYVLAGAVIGLFLPIAYIFEGILEGDKEGIKAASPHVFLLAAQVFMEGVTFSSSARFSLPIRAFVPIFYNTKRMFTIVEWVRGEIWKAEEGEHGSTRRLHVGRGLALANLLFWAFNLFGFLLPVYLPRAMKRYYGPKVKA